MFRSLISECRTELIEDGMPEADMEDADKPAPAASGAPRKNKHDRAAERMGFILATPLANMSRKKMMKMIPHLMHHFTKGHGKPGDDGSVDANDLATLSRHAQHISDQANGVRRMPGAAHHLAGHLTRHVADCHDRMVKAKKMQDLADEADLHANEGAKFRQLSKHHKMTARRHGIYDDSY
jgi:hypothetical protein